MEIILRPVLEVCAGVFVCANDAVYHCPGSSPHSTVHWNMPEQATCCPSYIHWFLWSMTSRPAIYSIIIGNPLGVGRMYVFLYQLPELCGSISTFLLCYTFFVFLHGDRGGMRDGILQVCQSSFRGWQFACIYVVVTTLNSSGNKLHIMTDSYEKYIFTKDKSIEVVLWCTSSKRTFLFTMHLITKDDPNPLSTC